MSPYRSPFYQSVSILSKAMRVMRIVSVLTLTASCSDNFAKSSLRDETSAVTAVTAVVDSSGNYTAAFEVNGGESQIMKVDSGQLKGSAISFPPGSLSIPVNLTIGQGSDLTSPALRETFGLSDNPPTAVGPSVSFVPQQNVEVGSPFTLSIPITQSTGLSLSDIFSTESFENYVVLYQGIQVVNGVTTYNAGVLPKDQVTITSKSVQFRSIFFGTFQLVKVPKIVTAPVKRQVEEAPKLKSQIVAIASLEYVTATMNYLVGETISSNAPKLNQDAKATSFSINPSIPAGLTFNEITGVFSGSPVIAQSQQKYTITAKNDVSQISTEVFIAITSIPSVDVTLPTSGTF